MRWLAGRAHRLGLALAGNLYYDGHDREAYERIAAELDIVLEEGGFERDCRPRQTDASWLDRVTLLQAVAAAKPLISMDTVCPEAARMTRAVNVWALANYLMIKGDRTYLALVSGHEGADYFQDFPELYLPIGQPLGGMERRGRVFVRRFERAVAVVNPSSTAPAAFEVRQPGWRDEVTGEAVSGPIDLPPASARVLIR